MGGRGRRWAALAAVLVVLAGAATAAAVLARSSGQPAPTSLVSLGDSYSSGEGDYSYGWESDRNRPHNACHRSERSYAPQLAQRRGNQPFVFAACSGAVTQDFFADNTNGNRTPAGAAEPAQVSRVGKNTATITLTVSGNDVGFAEVIAGCVYDLLHLVNSPGCAQDRQLTDAVQARITALSGIGSASTPVPEGGLARPIHSIREVLTALHQRAPKARIYLAGYPPLFGDFSGDRCRVGSVDVNTGAHVLPYPVYVSHDDARWMNEVAGQLTQTLRAQAESAAASGVPVTFVDVTPRWQGHGLCATEQSWLLPAAASFNVHSKSRRVSPMSFHPTQTGQAAGYLAALDAAGATH